ncbi:hypothetical protein HGP17_20090 [Rhizobium sp. P38BS-XIX]|uniref:hypothetical protein n=1 Tax=Rhizobium sp. P38BS-XIX TaxID=2726740 RepID=UPI001456A38A|nr:hypothetical protein [Rhizobium sp. P38BS-XIX]NLR99127.1 hypothetical protein [Rhizobium sp. P38BS-XIX]
MPLNQKLILHSPISDETLLEGFVEQCLRDKVSLLAIIGPGCEELEEKIDWLIIGDLQPGRFLCTTSHPHDRLEEVLAMATAWKAEGDVAEIHL